MNIFVIIPAYNEDKIISKVVEEIKSSFPEYKIIVIDDGSIDNTFQQALLSSVIVISHLINRGQGAALATGITYALNNNADIAVTFDADGQHDISDLPKIIFPLISNEADVTLGTRFSANNKIPFLRKIVLKLGIIFTWIFSGIKLTDVHNGFRGFNRRALEKIKLKQDRMAHSSEIIDEIKRNNLKFVEIPVKVNYTKYSLSKGQSAIDSFKIVKDLFIKKLNK